MKLFIKPALIAVALIAGGDLNAEWLNPERGLEVDPGAVSLPTYETGLLGVTECAECAPLGLSVTQDTKYFIAPRTPAVSLAEMRAAFYASVHDDNLIVYVFYDPNTMLVNRLVLDPST